jgi:POT family proton-dependent oligopeptide transporter
LRGRSILIAAPLVALWARQARAGIEPTSITKIATGAALIGASALLLSAGALLAGSEGRVSVLWVLAGYIGMGIGFMWY